MKLNLLTRDDLTWPRVCLFVTMLLLVFSLHATAENSTNASRGNWSGWSVVARDADSITHEITNEVSGFGGKVTPTVHRIVEVCSGLNYKDENGVWKPSRDLIEITADGRAAGTQAPHKVYFSSQLASEDAVTIVTRSNHTFRTHPLGLYYFDSGSGRLVQLAGVSSSIVGELQPPNQMVYRSAFRSKAIEADLRLTFTKSGLESDVILTHKPTPPEFFGLDPATTTLEIRHAWLGEVSPSCVCRNLESGLTDETINFGDLFLPTGKAFLKNTAQTCPNVPGSLNVSPPRSDPGALLVAKHWSSDGKMGILTESVLWKSIAPRIQDLPEPSPGSFDAPTTQASNATAVPENSRNGVVVATHPYIPKGFVFDYVAISGGGAYNFTSGTYWVNTLAQFTGPIRFYGGAVIKYSSGASLLFYGSPVACYGTSAFPTVLTSEDEDIFGEALPWSTGTPTYAAFESLWYSTPSTQTIKGMQVRWAQLGLEVDYNSAGTYSVSDCSFQFCQAAIFAQSANVTLINSSQCTVGTPLAGGGAYTFTGVLSDICTGDSDNNGTTDATEYQYFGRLGTLQGHALGQVSSRTISKSPQTDQPIYLLGSGGVINNGCWVAGVTGRSAIDYAATGSTFQHLPLTLVTPRHALTAWHVGQYFGNNFNVRFIDVNGIARDVLGIKVVQVLNTHDLAIAVFNQDLINTIVQPVQLLGTNVLNKLSPAFGLRQLNNLSGALPLVVCDQTNQAYTADANIFIDGWSPQSVFEHSIQLPTWGSRAYPANCNGWFGADTIDFDSGFPAFLLIRNELVLVGPMYGCNSPLWAGYSIDDINATITSLDSSVGHLTGYKAKIYDLSSFPSLQ